MITCSIVLWQIIQTTISKESNNRQHVEKFLMHKKKNHGVIEFLGFAWCGYLSSLSRIYFSVRNDTASSSGRISHIGIESRRDSAARENAAGRATKVFAQLSLLCSSSHFVIFLARLEDPARSFADLSHPCRFREISRRLAVRFILPRRRAGTSTSAGELGRNVSRKSIIHARFDWLIRFYWPAEIYRCRLHHRFTYMIDLHRSRGFTYVTHSRLLGLYLIIVTRR